jgi:hypothetical protein
MTERMRIARWLCFPAALLLMAQDPGCAIEPEEEVEELAGQWTELEDTDLRSVCPPNDFGGTTYDFFSFCPAVTTAWNSGTFDTLRNRLIVWGGGHNDYYGNEIYAIDLGSASSSRLNDPGVPVATSDPQESIVGGTQANSRHTYDGLQFLEDTGSLFVFGGYLAGPNGSFSQGTWTFDFQTLTWSLKSPTGNIPRAVSPRTAYDPLTGYVYASDGIDFYRYDRTGNSWLKLNSSAASLVSSRSQVIDPIHRKFALIGNGIVQVYSIAGGSTYTPQTLSVTGCPALTNAIIPGIAFHPTTETIVGWAGGTSVYSLDLETGDCTTIVGTVQTGSTAPPTTPFANGTYDRFSYSPNEDAFVLYQAMTANAWTLRIQESDAPTNSVVIHNTSGSTITDRPVSISRPFRKGDIAECVSASVSGTPVTTQTDVKNRWPDGSLKFAVVSFVVPSIASGGSVSVTFTNQASCNNSGFLDEAGMLAGGYNFDVDLALTETVAASVGTKFVDGNLAADCTSGNYSVANRNCTGSAGNAWNTLAEGVTNLASGNTLQIRAGTYTENAATVPCVGSFAATTTIEAYPGETVTWNNTDIYDNTLCLSSSANNVRIRGINFTGLRYIASNNAAKRTWTQHSGNVWKTDQTNLDEIIEFKSGCADIVTAECTKTCRGAGIPLCEPASVAELLSAGEDGDFFQNYPSDRQLYVYTTSGNPGSRTDMWETGFGITIGADSSSTGLVTVENNSFNGQGHAHLKGGYRWIVRNNIFTNVGTDANDHHLYVWSNLSAGNEAVYEYNDFVNDAGTGAAFHIYGTGNQVADQPPDFHWVRYNTVRDVGGSFWCALFDAADSLFVNNSCYGGGFMDRAINIQGVETVRNVIRNNLLYGVTYKPIIYEGTGGSHTTTHNITDDDDIDDGACSGCTINNNTILAASPWVDTTPDSWADFALAGGSVALNVGVNLGHPHDRGMADSDLTFPPSRADQDHNGTGWEVGAFVSGTAGNLSARAMLDAGSFRYWLQGPVVTSVIIEDRTAARAYDADFGDLSRALHPVFEARFYPQNNSVAVGATVENIWASNTAANGMRDLTYSLTIDSGDTSPTEEFTQTSFTHLGRSRWHKRFWIGTDPPSIRVDHNIDYLVKTGAIPHYETSVVPAEALIANRYSAWTASDKTIDGSATAIGNYARALNGTGEADWIGLMNTWDTLYLLSMDDRMLEMMLGNADLAGRIPWNFREADTSAGTGDFFDVDDSVGTVGRVISINARKSVSLSPSSLTVNCGGASSGDLINTGTITTDNWAVDGSHQPDTGYVSYLMTGRYYYLEQLQLEAAYNLGLTLGCSQQVWNRWGDTGYMNDAELRGSAWRFRTVAYAAFISPDGEPEQDYFTDKLENNIALQEGERNLPLSYGAKLSHWTWGNENRLGGLDNFSNESGISPLKMWMDRSPGFVQDPLRTDGFLESGLSPWEEHFLLVSFGMARQFGFKTNSLLRFMAEPRFNMLLDPASSRYHLQRYRWPAKKASTSDWVDNWADFADSFEAPTSSWAEGGSVDHGYGYIALGAASFLAPYYVDGYSGLDTWALFNSDFPGQDRFATVSPKWAITPFVE